MDSINGVTCIKGEIHSIMTIMRLNTRWSNPLKSLRGPIQHENPIVQSFRRLNEYLEGIFDLREVDCVVYLSPFHKIVVSDQASGPLTSAALSSLTKFAMFGFLDAGLPRVEEGIALVANCIPRCVFEETDWENDEVILMKLLELSTLVLRSSASSSLPISAAWDIYATCMSIHGQYRASKILRSEAETALRNLTLTAFSRCHRIVPTESTPNSKNHEKSWEDLSRIYTFGDAVGINLLLGKIMSVLSGQLDSTKLAGEGTRFALSLINIALEAGGSSLSSIGPLVDLLRTDICRHLLKASQSEDLATFSLSLRVVFNLFMSIKDHMKVQLEVFLTSVHLRLLQTAHSTVLSQAKEELALESLIEFCREPALMHDLYVNYDCDVQCTNLFDAIISTLCNRAIPVNYFSDTRSVSGDGNLESQPQHAELSILNQLSLYGVLSVLRAAAVRCDMMSDSKFENSHELSTDMGRGSLDEVDKWSQENPEVEGSSSTALPSGKYFLKLPDLSASRPSQDDLSGSPSWDANQVLPSSSQISRSSSRERGLSSASPFKNSDVGDPSEYRTTQNKSRSAEALRERKQQKEKLLAVINEFNERPLKHKWLALALDFHLVQPATAVANRLSGAEAKMSEDFSVEQSVDVQSVARFLRETMGLGKTQIGEYISKGPPDLFPFHRQVLLEYVGTFDFSGQDVTFVKALRVFLGQFRLPGESQCIDRLMEAFSGQVFKHLGKDNPFANADAAFILAFSTIMLNTDLHNPQIPQHKKMTKEQFLRNNRGINDKKDLPKEYLEELYDEIQGNQIQVDMDINSAAAIDFSDVSLWNKLIDKSSAYQLPAAFTPTVAAREGVRKRLNSICTDNERDMFLVMARPVQEMLLVALDNDADDSNLHRVIEGFADYCSVCASLRLPEILNGLLEHLSARTREVLVQARVADIQSSHGKQVVPFSLKLRKMESERGRRHNLGAFFATRMESLLVLPEAIAHSHRLPPTHLPGLAVASNGKESEAGISVNWTGAALFRGELMAKIVVSLCSLYAESLRRETWIAVFRLLLFARSRGALPDELSCLHDDWCDEVVASSLASAKAPEKFQLPSRLPSIYCCFSHIVARNLSLKEYPIYCEGNNESGTAGSVWLTVAASLGLWNSADEDKHKATFHSDAESSHSFARPGFARVRSPDGAIRILRELPSNLRRALLPMNANSNPFFMKEVPTEPAETASLEIKRSGESLRDLSPDELLSISLSNSAAADWLKLIAGLPDDNFVTIIAGLLDLLWKLSNLLFTDHSGDAFVAEEASLRKSIPNRGRTTSKADDCEPFDAISKEFEAIVVLEWIFTLLSSKPSRLLSHWPKIHEFLKHILEDFGLKAATASPYFLERCALFTIRASCFLLKPAEPSVVPAASSLPLPFPGAFRKSVDSSTGSVSVRAVDSTGAWASLRLLRTISPEIVGNIADQLGSALFVFIRFCPGAGSINTMEGWYLLFGLLSNITCCHVGRVHVWAILQQLFTNNFISELNFSPSRHLLLRYMCGVFTGEQERLPLATTTNVWKLPAMHFLVRLTNMALGGYVKFNREQLMKTANKLATQALPVCDRSIREIGDQFLFPLPKLIVPIGGQKKLASSPTATVSSEGIAAGAGRKSPVVELEQINNSHSNMFVTPICLSRREEVESLWIESVKTFADMSNQTPLEISQKATYCLQAVLLSGSASQLPAGLFCKALDEMLNRLPVSLITASSRLTNSSSDHIPFQFAIDCALRSCNVIFEVFVVELKKLRPCEEFQSLWLRFTSILATNCNLLNRGTRPHDEVIEMIFALLRLLKPPVINTTAAPATPTPSSASGSSPFGFLFGWTSPSPLPAADASSQEEQRQDLAKSSNNTDEPSIDSIDDGDCELISLCWKTMCSLCSTLPAAMKAKNPQLCTEIQRYVDYESNRNRNRKNEGSISLKDSKEAPAGSPNMLIKSPSALIV